MITHVSSPPVIIRLLAVMLLVSIALALMSFTAPYGATEWYCYDKVWYDPVQCNHSVPCGFLRGMNPYKQKRHTQKWCCNAYTCWAAGADNVFEINSCMYC